MERVIYSCYFCGEGVEDASVHALDPCAIILVSNIDKERKDHKEQEFFCHFECFRDHGMTEEIHYIEEPDFATIGEIAAEGNERYDR